MTRTTSGLQFLYYQQTTASNQWNINHNFGFMPICECSIYYNGTLTPTEPESIIQVDDNNVQVNWSSAFTGVAVLAVTPQPVTQL